MDQGGAIAFPPSSSNGYDSGFYFDLCGPGSTTFVAHSVSPSAVSSYSNSSGDGEGLHSTGPNGTQVYGWGWGWYGYLYEAAYWEMTPPGSYWSTYWNHLESFLNNNDGGYSPAYQDAPYDENESSLSFPEFKSDVDYDLQHSGVANVAEVHTLGLPEWSGQFDHFVAVNGWNPKSTDVNWVDTAYQSGAGPGGNTFGNFNESASTFYYNGIQGRDSSHDIIW